MNRIVRRAVPAIVLAAAMVFPAGAVDLPAFAPKARFPSFTTAPTAASHAEAARLLALPATDLPSFLSPRSAAVHPAHLSPAQPSLASPHAAPPASARGAPAAPPRRP